VSKKNKAIIISQINIIRLFYIGYFKSKAADIFIDLRTREHGLLITLCCKALGHDVFFSTLAFLFRLFYIKLNKIPHHDAVKDYHIINMKSGSDNAVYLNKYYRSKTFKTNLVYTNLFDDLDCMYSLTLKNIGNRFFSILCGVHVLKTMEYDTVHLWINKNHYPVDFIEMVSCEEKIHTNYFSDFISRITNTLIFSCLYFFTFIKCFCKCFSPKQKDKQSPMHASEYTDPLRNQASATDANFVSVNRKEQQLSYVRNKRKKLFPEEEFKLNNNTKVVYLDQIDYYFKDVWALGKFSLALLKDMLMKPRPFHNHFKQFEWLELFVGLSAFFRSFNIRTHIYNTFPNARFAGVRSDSGLITGICRKHKVHSLSYQTRVMHGDSHHFFDAFDIYGLWGKAWETTFQRQHFIKRFELIGCVFLDSYKLQNSNSKKDKQKKIVLFNSDVDKFSLWPFTLDYNLSFFTSVMQAIHEGSLEEKCNFQIIIKLKTKEQLPYLNAKANFTTLLNKFNQDITFSGKELYDTASLISDADMVIAIGFTTPGMDALLLGKKSIYFTPYEFRYNNIFFPGSPAVANNTEQLKQFLRSEKSIDPSFMDGLDPFRDGKAGQRLGMICEKILNPDRQNATLELSSVS